MSADPARRHRQFAVLAILSIVITATLMSVNSPRPRLIYNASQSAPIGWYRVEFRRPSHDDFVVIRPSGTLQSLLVAHAVLPPGIPLLKRVVAVAGDRVCRSRTVVFVNGEAIAESLERDQNQRPLPVWEGCFTLFAGQFFVLQQHPFSFDSRYFGPVGECQIVGVAHPIRTWNHTEADFIR
jgi:conjugative transfer signal peptidase TraF